LSNARSLEKVRPKVPKELVEACSNAVADARELKSAASFIFKADGALITKVPPPTHTYHTTTSSIDRAQMGSAKKAKDPNAPKRAMSGCGDMWCWRVLCIMLIGVCRYTLFVKQVSADIRAATPGLNAVSVMKECGAKWQALSVQQKEEWNNKSKQ
jgi:hypothetical protein